MKSSGKRFLGVGTCKLHSEVAKVVACAGSRTLSRVKSLGATGFEGTKGSWRKAETWYCERPGEAIGEGTAGVIMEAPGLKGSWRTAETLDHEESPAEGQPGYRRRPQLFGDSSAMGLLSSKRAAVEWG